MNTKELEKKRSHGAYGYWGGVFQSLLVCMMGGTFAGAHFGNTGMIVGTLLGILCCVCGVYQDHRKK